MRDSARVPTATALQHHPRMGTADVSLSLCAACSQYLAQLGFDRRTLSAAVAYPGDCLRCGSPNDDVARKDATMRDVGWKVELGDCDTIAVYSIAEGVLGMTVSAGNMPTGVKIELTPNEALALASAVTAVADHVS